MPELPLTAEQDVINQLNLLSGRIKAGEFTADSFQVEATFSEITATYKHVKIGSLKKVLTRLLPPAESKEKGAEPKAREPVGAYSEEELEAARQLSLEPNIYLEHRKTFKTLGYCGKESLKDAALNANIKRLLSRSSADISTGNSASGKSALWDTEEKLLPPELVVSFTSLTENALNYLGSVKHKILKLGELPPRKPNEKEDTPQWSYLRQLISDNKLERGVPVKKENGTGFELKKYLTDGPCVVWATTTRTQQDFIDEVVNRCGWIHSDESEATTAAVNTEQASRDEKPFDYSEEEERKTTSKWKAYNANLKSYSVIIPYAHHLRPNPKYLTARRLYPLISNNVRVSALVHQSTRNKPIHSGEEYLLAEIADYENVHQLVNSNAPKILDLVAPVALEAFRAIREQLKDKKLTVADLIKLLNQSDATVRRWRTQYLKAGLLELCEERKGKAELVELGAKEPDEIETMALGIIAPEELKRQIANCSKCSESLKDSLKAPISEDSNLLQIKDRQKESASRDGNLSPSHDLLNFSDRIEPKPSLGYKQPFSFSSAAYESNQESTNSYQENDNEQIEARAVVEL